MSFRLRLASGLLLVMALVPLARGVDDVRFLLDPGMPLRLDVLDWGFSLLRSGSFGVFLVAASVFLWRGHGWAYASALVCSAMLAVIQVLYHAAAWQVWPGGVDLLVGAILLLLVWIAAAPAVLLAREGRFPEHRRRAWVLVGWALAAELLLMALIAWRGAGGISDGPYDDALYLTQLPAETLLYQLGMCCGYSNATIIGDVWDPHWGVIRPRGIPALAAANALVLAGVLAIIRVLSIRLRHLAGFGTPAVALTGESRP